MFAIQNEAETNCSDRAEDEVRNVLGIMIANMVGSFLMGFLTENKAHLVWFEQPKMPVSFLPENHFVQHHEELLVGLRVGFCGSLTTFASWAFQMVNMMSRGRVDALAIVLLLEISASLVSFTIGEHLAIRVHMFVKGVGHTTRHKEERTRLWHNIRKNAIFATITKPPTSPPADPDPDAGSREMKTAKTAKTARHRHHHGISVLEGDAGDQVWVIRGRAGGGRDGEGMISGSGATGVMFAEKYDVDGPLAMTNPHLRLREGSDPLAWETTVAAAEEPTAEEPPPPAEDLGAGATRKWSLSRRNRRSTEATRDQRKYIMGSNILFTLALVGLTTGMAVLVKYDKANYARRQCWLSLLLAPFGCFIRWHLCTHYNSGVLKGTLTWFPMGTFAINVGGTTLNALSSALKVHYCIGASNMYWVGVCIGAFQTGFNGSLSTVSTLMGEVHKYMYEYPRNFKGWVYLAATFASSLILGFAGYGWSVFARTKC